jgi:hypothetical protein
MRFNYNPESGILSFYVKKEEFALAACQDPKHENEYRVFERDFSKVSIHSFVEEFSDFTQHIFNSIFPDEKLKDIIAISTCSGGYTWTSLLKLEYQDQAQNFMNNLISYALHTMQQQSQKTKSEFLKDLSPEESAKLNLIIGLVNSLSYPQPWKRKKTKNIDPDVELSNKINLLTKKIKVLENKYKFSTGEMLKYYNDDILPDEEFTKWMKYSEELKAYEEFKSKKSVLKQIVDLWMNTGVASV